MVAVMKAVSPPTAAQALAATALIEVPLGLPATGPYRRAAHDGPVRRSLRRGAGIQAPGVALGPAVAHDRRSAGRNVPVVLDETRLASIDLKVRTQLVDLFVSSARQRITALREAAAECNAPAINALAHALKGSAATVGAQRLNEACERLGEAAARERVDQITVRQEDLEKAFALTVTALAAGNGRAANG